ncbi:MAG: acetyltransferase, N-acetylglutamate synthase [Anaerosolibacter sp.]|jgi:ribosomal protein S18 acetylase RimI-like enzyme|uniref:GNAT family N-acetyltransferase n=1 Tax=Anaerosolibacter sp. TaxID=1872527 RepID=UPI0026158718|nr:GNAT family N-acetyltransferase [Anaerosolibacter sp.]MDF2545959.1 acetyltransferase, N-acetylglutamate synthase [Anaerosolibacter sp.]
MGYSIKLTEKLNKHDYDDINLLQNICFEVDQTALKLELAYKLGRSEGSDPSLNNINEFMYYEKDNLVGYIGIGDFGGAALEVNGMVHPDYRRRGIFKRLFSLVSDEWNKRDTKNMLLLSDPNSIAGREFIQYTGAHYKNSEYEMFLKRNGKTDSIMHNVTLRKASNKDAEEIARQNAVYFDIEYKEEDITLPEEDERCGLTAYLAEIDGEMIGKVNVQLLDGVGGIYGLGVLPAYRGKGYGRAILTWAVEKLKESNAKEIMLQVAVKNNNALNLYKSCGFEVTSTMDYYEISR